MTRLTESQIAENRNPKSPENRPQQARFLRYRLLYQPRSPILLNGLSILHGRRHMMRYERRTSSRATDTPKVATLTAPVTLGAVRSPRGASPPRSGPPTLQPRIGARSLGASGTKAA